MKKMMLYRMIGRKRKTGMVPVYLNVYDLTPMNGYAYWLGLGIYHSGVQVHGVEYALGTHEHPTTRIFEVEPKGCPGFTFRKSIFIGRSDLGLKEVRIFMEKLAGEYSGNTYNLITKNCNYFCNNVCLRLIGKLIPKWVNRLARFGLFCNFVLPAGLNKTKVRHVRAENKNCENKKHRSQSSRFASTSNAQKFASTLGSTGARSCRHRSQHSSSTLSSPPLPKTHI